MNDNNSFRSSQYLTRIRTITFRNTLSNPSNAEKVWNLGTTTGTVQAYVIKNGDLYNLYIEGNGSLYANPNSSYLFYGMTNLVRINNMEILNTSRVTNMSYMFADCVNLNSLSLNSFSTSRVTKMQHMFENCRNLSRLNLGNFRTYNVTNMSYMFANCVNLRSLSLDSFDTSQVTNMNYMFYFTRSLTSSVLPTFRVPYVTDMSYMFYKSAISNVKMNATRVNSNVRLSNFIAPSQNMRLVVRSYNDKSIFQNANLNGLRITVSTN